MPSLLNFSNSSKFEEFNLKDIEVLVNGEGQHWFKQTHDGKFLEIKDNRTLLNVLEKCEILTRQELILI